MASFIDAIGAKNLFLKKFKILKNWYKMFFVKNLYINLFFSLCIVRMTKLHFMQQVI